MKYSISVAVVGQRIDLLVLPRAETASSYFTGAKG
jgi:hypothetical protein